MALDAPSKPAPGVAQVNTMSGTVITTSAVTGKNWLSAMTLPGCAAASAAVRLASSETTNVGVAGHGDVALTLKDAGMWAERSAVGSPHAANHASAANPVMLVRVRMGISTSLVAFRGCRTPRGRRLHRLLRGRSGGQPARHGGDVARDRYGLARRTGRERICGGVRLVRIIGGAAVLERHDEVRIEGLAD